MLWLCDWDTSNGVYTLSKVKKLRRDCERPISPYSLLRIDSHRMLNAQSYVESHMTRGRQAELMTVIRSRSDGQFTQAESNMIALARIKGRAITTIKLGIRHRFLRNAVDTTIKCIRLQFFTHIFIVSRPDSACVEQLSKLANCVRVFRISSWEIIMLDHINMMSETSPTVLMCGSRNQCGCWWCQRRSSSSPINQVSSQSASFTGFSNVPRTSVR